MSGEAWDRDAFVQRLRAVGMSRYHHQHPFHLNMNAGNLTPEQLRGWAANRFYYQRNIPLKDAAILSNCPVREVRRLWLHRLSDHDGHAGTAGGIEAWLMLAEATGLTREETLDGRHVVPGVRFAAEAYVRFAREQPWPIAVASSLTELFAPDLMRDRLSAFERHYRWVRPEGLAYFRSRLTLARNDLAGGTGADPRPLHHPGHAGGGGARALLQVRPALGHARCDDARLWGAVPRPMEIGSRTRLKLNPKVRLRHDDPSGKTALVFPENVLFLNPSGTAIVELCNGRTLGEIVAVLAERYQVPSEQIERDVRGYLVRLSERGLLVTEESA